MQIHWSNRFHTWKCNPNRSQERYKDEVIMMSEILFNKAKERKKRRRQWLNNSVLIKSQCISSVEHYIVIKNTRFIFINTKECQWYMKWEKRANNQTAQECVLFLKKHLMYMPTLPYKENIWKKMPQNVNTHCRGQGGVVGDYRKYLSVFLILAYIIFITRKRQ